MAQRDQDTFSPYFEDEQTAVEQTARIEARDSDRSDHRILRFAGKAILGLGGGVLLASQLLQQHTIEGNIGPHRAEIHVNFSGAATLGLGPIGAIRAPLDTPFDIGVKADLQETSATGKQLIDEYIELGQHPDGEITYLRDTIMSEAEKDLLYCITGSELLLFGGAALWRRNRRNLQIGKAEIVTSAAIAALAVSATALPRAFSGDEAPIYPDAWVPITSAIPPQDLRLLPFNVGNVQIRGSELKTGIAAAWPFVKEKFITSTVFYEGMRQDFYEQAGSIPAKQPDEVRAVVASDRHDNVAMESLLKAVIQKTSPDIFIDGGDDTSSGDPAEAFSLNSLVEATKGVKNRLVVLGNHDSSFNRDVLRKNGFTVLDDEHVVSVKDLRFMGAADPRHSDLGMKIKQSDESVSDIAGKIAEKACSEDKNVDVVVTHDPEAGDTVANRGCAALTIAGHMHKQIGPSLQENLDGTAVYRFVNGTTGGAREAISLGPISAPADITMFSFKVDTAGHPYLFGWQEYRFTTSGKAEVKPFEFADITKTQAELRDGTKSRDSTLVDRTPTPTPKTTKLTQLDQSAAQ